MEFLELFEISASGTNRELLELWESANNSWNYKELKWSYLNCVLTNQLIALMFNNYVKLRNLYGYTFGIRWNYWNTERTWKSVIEIWYDCLKLI